MNDSPATMEVAEPVVHQVGITAVAEASPVVISTSDPKPATFATSDAGYTPIDIPKPLYNQYLVDQFSWAYTDAIGAIVHYAEFPDLLLAKPDIPMKLATFRYWDPAKTELEIKINSTPFHFGSLMAVFVPRIKHNGAAAAKYCNLYQLMQMGGTILSASSRNSVKMTLDRFPVTTFDPTVNPGPVVGTVFFLVETPLRLSGSASNPANVTVSIFANFSQITLAGYGEPDSEPAIQASLMKRRLARPHARIVKQSYSRTKTQDKSKTPPGPDKEAETKSKGGIISTVLSTVGSFAPVLEMSPLAEFTPIAWAAGAVAPFFASLGLSKPPTVSSIQPLVQGSRRGMSQGNGLASHERMAIKSDSYSAVKNIPGMSQPDIVEICKKHPAWVGTFFFDKTFGPEAQLRSIPLIPTLCFRSNQTTTDVWVPGFMAYFTSFFTKWRGGFKIALHFVCSSFTTATVRLTHNAYNNVLSAPEDYAGAHVSEVIEIRGETWYQRSYPYLSTTPDSRIVGFYQPTGTPRTDLAVDSLSLTVVNPATTSDEVGDSSIYYAIYISGADDFSLKDYNGFILRPAENELAPIVPQSVTDRFSEPFKPMIPALAAMAQGYTDYEGGTNLIELMHMETWHQSNVDVDFTDTYISEKNLLMQPFQFWRGSYRYRSSDAGTGGPGSMQGFTLYSNDNWSSWMTGKFFLFDGVRRVYTQPDVKQDVAVEVPWCYNTMCVPIYPDFHSDDPNYDNYPTLLLSPLGSFTRTDNWFAVGEDFMVGGLVPPPRFSIDDYVAPPPSAALTKTKDIVRGVSSSSGAAFKAHEEKLRLNHAFDLTSSSNVL